MSIRSDALQWFNSKHNTDGGKIYTSKYYLPEESWPKTHVWWIQIPLNELTNLNGEFIHLICQTSPGGIDFHYLKVPIQFLEEHLNKFDIVQNKMVHLYLSADPGKLFIEERGTGKLNFAKFLVR